MARSPLVPFRRYLHARRHAADADAALLARYTADRDDSAFAELVRRHGPLVWRVCRQVLGHEQDAEDAFQATFFLLARGAGSVRDGAAVAGWLYGTAWRVAQKARIAAAARRERERHAAVREVGDAAAEAALRELQTMLPAEPSGKVHWSSEPQTANLVLDRPTQFQGRIMDDLGRPVVGAKIGIEHCDRLNPRPMELMLVGSGFWTMTLPIDRTTATTDRDGRFRLGGVSADLIARLTVGHPDFPQVNVTAAASSLPAGRPVSFQGVQRDDVWTGDINLTLAAARAFPIRIVSSITDKPVAGAQVWLSKSGKAGLTSAQVTDRTGQAILRMPPGDCRLAVVAPGQRTPFEVPEWDKLYYVRHQETLTVPAQPADQPHTVRLTPCCTVLAEVVDAGTGQPIVGELL